MSSRTLHETMRQLAADGQYREIIDMLRGVPAAWFVKDFADGWIPFNNEADARREAEETGATLLVAYAVKQP